MRASLKMVPIAALALAACNTDGGNFWMLADAGAGGGGGSTASGAFSLTVRSARSRVTIDRVSAGNGKQFIVVDLTLTNTGETRPIPTLLPMFSLRTASNLVIQANALSADLDMPCPTDTSVGSGGSIQCSMAFAISTTDNASKLEYSDLMGRSATAAIPALQMIEVCDAWTRIDERDCGTCVNHAVNTSCNKEQTAHFSDCVDQRGSGWCYRSASFFAGLCTGDLSKCAATCAAANKALLECIAPHCAADCE